jgi:hypothetical protein
MDRYLAPVPGRDVGRANVAPDLVPDNEPPKKRGRTVAAQETAARPTSLRERAPNMTAPRKLASFTDDIAVHFKVCRFLP